MGILERKEREKQEMRKQILEASLTMFSAEGYEKTSIRKIANKIEYSPATIYLYYKDKDELLYDVQREAFEKLFEYLNKKAVSKDPLTRLQQLCKAYFNFGMKHQDLYDLMFIIRSPMNVIEEKESWTNGDHCFALLVTCVQDCMEQKLINYTDGRIATLSIWSLCHGFVSLNLRCRLKVMDLKESEVEQLLNRAIEDFLQVIQTK